MDKSAKAKRRKRIRAKKKGQRVKGQKRVKNKV